MIDQPITGPILHPDAVASVNKLMAQFDAEDLKLREILRNWLVAAKTGPIPEYLINRTEAALQSRPMRMPLVIVPAGTPPQEPTL